MTVATDGDVDAPAAEMDGRLLITAATGPRCADRGNFAECPQLAAESCTNDVVEVAPGQRGSRLVFRMPGRVEINDAVPSPSGRRIAVGQSP